MSPIQFLLLVPLGGAMVLAGSARAEDPMPSPAAVAGKAPDLAAIKEAEAAEKLKALEETMERLARRLAATEPGNAAKLRSAFDASREKLVRESMERAATLLREGRIDRAVEDQRAVARTLDEVLAILLEKEAGPREIVKAVRELKGVVRDLDRLIDRQAETRRSTELVRKGRDSGEAKAAELARIDGLIDAEKRIETDLAASAGEDGPQLREGLRRLAGRQREVMKAAERLGDLAAAKTSSPSGPAGPKGPSPSGSLASGKAAGQAGGDGAQAGSAGTQAGSAGAGQGGAASGAGGGKTGTLADAVEAMASAAGALEAGSREDSAESTADARRKLEAVRKGAEESLSEEDQPGHHDLDRLQAREKEDAERAGDVLKRMERTPPLVASPEGGVPGRADVARGKGAMESAAGSLGSAKPEEAARSEDEALRRLKDGRKKAEETLEDLRRNLRERLLSQLRDSAGKMLEEQRKVTAETATLDARLQAAGASGAADRKDLQAAGDLGRREGEIAGCARDMADLLTEDGTSLAFPRIVAGIREDLEAIRDRLAKAETGAVTQREEKAVEGSLADLLASIDEARRAPPPPKGGGAQGEGRRGSGPLLTPSMELKLIRALQKRVNEETRNFDRTRPSGRSGEDAEAERAAVARRIASRQREVEDLVRKVSGAGGE